MVHNLLVLIIREKRSSGVAKQLNNIHHRHIFLRHRELIFVVVIMSTIDELEDEIRNLNDEIRKLKNEIDPYREQLTELLKQSTGQQLDAELKQVIDSRISANHQIIIAKENQILAKENQILANKNLIIEKEKQKNQLKKNEGSKIPLVRHCNIRMILFQLELVSPI